jgi:hypothetical protein
MGCPKRRRILLFALNSCPLSLVYYIEHAAPSGKISTLKFADSLELYGTPTFKSVHSLGDYLRLKAEIVTCV